MAHKLDAVGNSPGGGTIERRTEPIPGGGDAPVGVADVAIDRTVVTANGTTQIKATPGKVSHVVVWGAGSGWTLALYDDPDSDDNQVWQFLSAHDVGTFAIQMPMKNGIRVVASGAVPGSATICWR